MVFQKCKDFTVKPTFSTVGGSVWELKIDPKRFREEIKNIIEKRRTKIGDKKSIKDHKKRLKKL